MTSRVSVVDLGRERALGATRRVASWVDVWTAAGADVEIVRLVPEHPLPLPLRVPALASAAVRPSRVPETALWSPRALRQRLRAMEPDVVVFVTARSFVPGVAPAGAVAVLDHVDHMSENYAQRARAGSGGRSLVLRALAAQMRRFERQDPRVAVRTAAGRADAATLGAQWVPNVVAVPDLAPRRPDVDLLFVGSLDYEPNVEAVRRLLRLWPRVQELRPGTTLLVAGSRPGRQLSGDVVAAPGCSLHADFAAPEDVWSRARIAVSPLSLGTGIQNKVLEAAAHGLPQVVDPLVLRGVGPDFPAVVAADDEDLVRAVVRLLEQPGERAELARRGRTAVEHCFTAAAWADWARALLADRPTTAVLPAVDRVPEAA